MGATSKRHSRSERHKGVIAALVVATSLVTLAGPSPASSQPSEPGFEIERVPWVGSIGQGGGVTVVNRFGNVRARFGGYDGRVEVLANLQQFAREGARLEVETVTSAAGVEIRVGFRASDSDELVTARDPNQRKRADLAVFVPQGGTFVVTTDEGLVQVKGVKSDVKARTSSGEIFARQVSGDLDLASESGDIVVALEDRQSARDQSVVSATGDLTAILSEEASYAVRVGTSGLISTDFTMDIDYRDGREPLKLGTVSIGKAATRLVLSTGQGHVRITGRPVAHKARVRD